MHFQALLATLLGAATQVHLASAGSIRVNYYTDGGCYNCQWTGSNSANIANCNGFRQCTCLFYRQPNCAGGLQAAQYGGKNCASNWGWGWVSFRCQGIN